MMNKTLLTFASLIALTAVPAMAQLTVGGTYNTGYNGNTALAPGSVDPTLMAYVPNAGELPSSWTTAAGAQFISPSPDESFPPLPYEGGLPGDDIYVTTVSNGFAIPTEITISGSYAADNTLEIDADGRTEVPFAVTSPNSEFGSLTPFSFTFLANPGSTTLDFVVENYNSDNSDPFLAGSDGNLNPVGLLVSNLKITVAPEPSTWAMMFAGLAALVLLPRLRRVLSL
jgi:hypothetical protein